MAPIWCGTIRIGIRPIDHDQIHSNSAWFKKTPFWVTGACAKIDEDIESDEVTFAWMAPKQHVQPSVQGVGNVGSKRTVPFQAGANTRSSVRLFMAGEDKNRPYAERYAAIMTL